MTVFTKETTITKDECVKLLEERGFEDGHLDGLVHDEASHRASAVNNAGLAEQVAYLCEHSTVQEVLEDAFGYKRGTDDLEARRLKNLSDDEILSNSFAEDRERLEGRSGPKSVCMCGHTGDGPNSEHYDPVMPKGFEGENQGHGHCTVDGCKCGTFVCKGFING